MRARMRVRPEAHASCAATEPGCQLAVLFTRKACAGRDCARSKRARAC